MRAFKSEPKEDLDKREERVEISLVLTKRCKPQKHLDHVHGMMQSHWLSHGCREVTFGAQMEGQRPYLESIALNWYSFDNACGI